MIFRSRGFDVSLRRELCQGKRTVRSQDADTGRFLTIRNDIASSHISAHCAGYLAKSNQNAIPSLPIIPICALPRRGASGEKFILAGVKQFPCFPLLVLLKVRRAGHSFVGHAEFKEQFRLVMAEFVYS